MKQTLETNRIITGSLFIIATIAVSFILNFYYIPNIKY